MSKSRPKRPAETAWTSRRLLDWTAGHLEQKQVESPRLAAEMLLAHVLEVPRLHLYLDMDRPASPLERAAYRDLVERAVNHEPVQYLVGHTPFFSLDIHVRRGVLVPRPCTEMLVEHVIRHTRQTPGFACPLIADIGTGSGCIAVALARNLPDARVIATDVSAEALEIAADNANRHGVTERIEFRLGPHYEPIAHERFRFLVANPPYISDAQWDDVPPNVKDYEPTAALRSGADGMDHLGVLIDGAAAHLETPGQVVFEIAASQEPVVLARAESAGLKDAKVLADHEGHPRMLLADHA